MQLNHKERIVAKPWGIAGIGEVWHCLSKDFCAKTIRIARGFRTSFQYHVQKEEINFIRSGEAELLLEDENGAIQKYHLKPGDSFYVPAPRKHRVIALTDLEMFEVSNEFVDDVVRINDEFGRTDGKIADEHKTPAALILCAGKGERVKSVTRGLHKALLKVGGKAAISHLLDKIDPAYDIIVALGHNGNLIRDYLNAAHPDRKFTFVTVPDFESINSGPGKSAAACKEYLARPFYLLTCDVLFEGPLPALDASWIGTSPTDLPEIYSTAQIDKEGNVTDFKNKSAAGYGDAFVGIAGVRDHAAFWESLGDSKEVVTAFERRTFKLKARPIEWIDIGNVDGVRKLAGSGFQTLSKKLEEDTYQVGGRVIKLNANRQITQERIERAVFLGDLIPTLTGKFDYAFSYDFLPGQTLYALDSYNAYERFINYYFSKVVTADTAFAYSPVQLTAATRKFYVTKTEERLKTFLDDHRDLVDVDVVVNGETVSAAPLKKVNLEFINSPEMSKHFHGDLQPDNILMLDDGTFRTIDWRNSFAGLFDGDLYYDLGKLWAGLSFSYLAAKDPAVFEFNRIGTEFFYKVPQTDNMRKARDYLEKKLMEEGFELERVRRVAGLVWLNMSPIHPGDMGIICYLEGLKALQHG